MWWRAAYRKVMFFESLPAGDEPAPRRLPERSPSSGPPPLETGAVLAVERMVARSANVVVRVPVIRAFRTGCMIDVEIVSRQGALSDDDWWDLHLSAHRGLFGSHGGARLPDKLLRFGVRYLRRTRRRGHRGRRRAVWVLLARYRAQPRVTGSRITNYGRRMSRETLCGSGCATGTQFQAAVYRTVGLGARQCLSARGARFRHIGPHSLSS